MLHRKGKHKPYETIPEACNDIETKKPHWSGFPVIKDGYYEYKLMLQVIDQSLGYGKIWS